jgi:prepilin peptidase CpaA
MIRDLAMVIFPALMLFAAFADLFTFTIPNRIPILLFLCYFFVAFYAGFPIERIGLDVLCGVAVLFAGMGLFSANLIGGGDAKLAAASVVWVGWENLFSYGLVASIFGLALTVLIVCARFYDMPAALLSVRFISRLVDKQSGVPFGVALAVSGLLLYPHTKIWMNISGVA